MKEENIELPNDLLTIFLKDQSKKFNLISLDIFLLKKSFTLRMANSP